MNSNICSLDPITTWLVKSSFNELKTAMLYRVSQKERNPRKEALFERVKINFNARTCIIWLKDHGISHLDQIYTQLVIIWRKQGF